MSYQRLLKERKIKTHRATKEEIKDILEVADRDLKFAKEAMAHNWDWAFAIAYNAALSASRAYMYQEGYRPTSSESHKTVWRFMLVALPKENHDRIYFFDRMRVKRNKNLYDQVGLISETEGRQIIQSAEKHISAVKERLS